MFTRLLVPLDGSRLAESVLSAVVGLAEAAAGEVTLLHVIEKKPPSAIHGDVHLREEEEAESYLAEISERLKARGLRVEAHVHSVPEGDIPKAIVDHAEELNRDLIVLCTHGRGGVRRFVFGSNAEQVLSRGLTPALLVKARPAGDVAAFTLKTIVALIDAPPGNAAALGAAVDLARLFRARLHLLSVVPTPGSVGPEQAASCRLAPHTTRQLLNIAAEEAAGRMRGEIESLRRESIEATGVVERGDVGEAVLKTASERGADLIVFAARGLSGFGAFLEDVLIRRIAGAYDGPLLLMPVENPI